MVAEMRAFLPPDGAAHKPLDVIWPALMAPTLAPRQLRPGLSFVKLESTRGA